MGNPERRHRNVVHAACTSEATHSIASYIWTANPPQATVSACQWTRRKAQLRRDIASLNNIAQQQQRGLFATVKTSRSKIPRSPSLRFQKTKLGDSLVCPFAEPRDSRSCGRDDAMMDDCTPCGLLTASFATPQYVCLVPR